MDNEDQINIKAKIEYDQMIKHQSAIEEFKSLGSKTFGIKDILQFIAPFILLMISQRLFNIDSDTYQLVLVIFVAITFVQVMIAAENKKVNRRIELLLEILKQERGDKNT